MGEGPVNGTGIGRLWRRWRRPYTAVLAAGALAAGGAIGATVASASTSSANTTGSVAAPAAVSSQAYRVFAPTATPIKHLVVIYDENVSFDHYFGTYPTATNPAGQPQFAVPPGPPVVDGLQNVAVPNPNHGEPQRIDRTQPITCDQDHGYTDEQTMFDNGAMDQFVAVARDQPSCTLPRGKNIVMDYYDGNTVTALWNLAAHFTLSDA